MELISERAAARIMARRELSRSASQHLLRTGVAGRPMVAAGVYLYESDRVEELVGRPELTREECARLFPDGCLVARLAREHSVDASAQWPDSAAALRAPWPLGPWQLLTVYCWRRMGRSVPLLLTVGGCVISGALVADLRHPGPDAPPGTTRFDLDPPGPWLDQVRGRILALGRGAPVELVRPLAVRGIDRSGESVEARRR